MLFSFSTDHYSKIYTKLDCITTGYDPIALLRDYPAGLSTTDTVSSTSFVSAVGTPISAKPSISTTPPPTSTSKPLPPTSAATSVATSTPLSTSLATGDTKSTPTGAIAGGVVGGLAVIALFILAILYINYRRKIAPPAAHHESYQNSGPAEMPATVPEKTTWSPEIGVSSPVPPPVHVVPGLNEVHGSPVQGGGGRAEIV